MQVIIAIICVLGLIIYSISRLFLDNPVKSFRAELDKYFETQVDLVQRLVNEINRLEAEAASHKARIKALETIVTSDDWDQLHMIEKIKEIE